MSDLVAEVKSLKAQNEQKDHRISVLEATACRSSPSTAGGGTSGGTSSSGTSPPAHGIQQCVSPTTGVVSQTETLPFGNDPETTRAQAEAGIKQGKRVCFCVN